MAARSLTHQRLVAEPMGTKPVRDLPGIGEMYGPRLREQSITQVALLDSCDILFIL